MGLRADRGSGTSLSKALLERFSMGVVLWGSLPEGKVSRQSSRKPSGGCWEHHGWGGGGAGINDRPSLTE